MHPRPESSLHNYANPGSLYHWYISLPRVTEVCDLGLAELASCHAPSTFRHASESGRNRPCIRSRLCFSRLGTTCALMGPLRSAKNLKLETVGCRLLLREHQRRDPLTAGG